VEEGGVGVRRDALASLDGEPDGGGTGKGIPCPEEGVLEIESASSGLNGLGIGQEVADGIVEAGDFAEDFADDFASRVFERKGLAEDLNGAADSGQGVFDFVGEDCGEAAEIGLRGRSGCS